MPDSKKIYEVLRKTSLDEWKKMKPEQIAKNLGLGKTADSLMQRQDGVFIQLAARIAHETTDAEFDEFFQSGETPPMKMTTEEMQALKGGGKKRYSKWDILANAIISSGGQIVTTSISPGSNQKGRK